MIWQHYQARCWFFVCYLRCLTILSKKMNKFMRNKLYTRFGYQWGNGLFGDIPCLNEAFITIVCLHHVVLPLPISQGLHWVEVTNVLSISNCHSISLCPYRSLPWPMCPLRCHYHGFYPHQVVITWPKSQSNCPSSSSLYLANVPMNCRCFVRCPLRAVITLACVSMVGGMSLSWRSMRAWSFFFSTARSSLSLDDGPPSSETLIATFSSIMSSHSFMPSFSRSRHNDWERKSLEL